ncbi:hypothetical protein BROUX41_006139 [Berkeleyomyces rouxiae]|uniref:uncharacterized protein n=1 Tax=Berkeleyomyces rouxiae TaxID=2035830 RepID=UPI003B77C1D6
MESKPVFTTTTTTKFNFSVIPTSAMPINSQTTLPPNLENISWYVDKKNYPMELLDSVKNLEDLAKLPPVPVYIYGQSTSAQALYVFRDYSTTMHQKGQTLFTVAHAELTRTVPAANPAQITAPPALDLPSYIFPYGIDF